MGPAGCPCVPANYERLRLVHLVLEPCTTALAGFVAGVLALSDDTLEAELFTNGISSGGVISSVSDNPIRGVRVLRSAAISLSSSRLVSSGT
jgi:hypothetical protein